MVVIFVVAEEGLLCVVVCSVLSSEAGWYPHVFSFSLFFFFFRALLLLHGNGFSVKGIP
jgi:hypothetical protein